jgi:hypothetical protein
MVMEQSGDDDRGREPTIGPLLRTSDFTQRIGQSFSIAFAGTVVELTIAAVEELPHSQRDGGGFRIEFLGPRAWILPQGIYAFALDGVLHDIFIVPLAPDARNTALYEAIFF